MIERRGRVLVLGSPALTQVMNLALVPGDGASTPSEPRAPYQFCCCRTQQELAAMMASNELPPDVIVAHFQRGADRLAAVKYLKASLYRWIPILVLIPDGQQNLWSWLSLHLAGAARVMKGPCQIANVLKTVAKLSRRWIWPKPVKRSKKKKSAPDVSVLPLAA